MNKLMVLLTGFMLVAACSTSNEFPWQTGSLSDVVSKAGSKIIIVDFYTEW